MAPWALVRADARPPALLASEPDVRSPALLALAPLALVRADVRSPALLALLIWRWCGQMLRPPHSLHLLLLRWCGQTLRGFFVATPASAASASPRLRRLLLPPPADVASAASFSPPTTARQSAGPVPAAQLVHFCKVRLTAAAARQGGKSGERRPGACSGRPPAQAALLRGARELVTLHLAKPWPFWRRPRHFGLKRRPRPGAWDHVQPRAGAQ